MKHLPVSFHNTSPSSVLSWAISVNTQGVSSQLPSFSLKFFFSFPNMNWTCSWGGKAARWRIAWLCWCSIKRETAESVPNLHGGVPGNHVCNVLFWSWDFGGCLLMVPFSPVVTRWKIVNFFFTFHLLVGICFRGNYFHLSSGSLLVRVLETTTLAQKLKNGCSQAITNWANKLLVASWV